MKTSVLHHQGPDFKTTHVYALGMKYKAGASDFDAAATSQVITLDFIAPGDIVRANEVRLDMITAIGSAAATWSVKVGITGDDDRFLASTNILPVAEGVLPTVAADLAPYINNTASPVALILTITPATGNVNATTDGEFWISVPMSHKVDRVTLKKNSF